MTDPGRAIGPGPSGLRPGPARGVMGGTPGHRWAGPCVRRHPILGADWVITSQGGCGAARCSPGMRHPVPAAGCPRARRPPPGAHVPAARRPCPPPAHVPAARPRARRPPPESASAVVPSVRPAISPGESASAVGRGQMPLRAAWSVPGARRDVVDGGLAPVRTASADAPPNGRRWQPTAGDRDASARQGKQGRGPAQTLGRLPCTLTVHAYRARAGPCTRRAVHAPPRGFIIGPSSLPWTPRKEHGCSSRP